MKENKQEHICNIHKKHLFAEELKWMQTKFPNNSTLEYPKFVEALLEAVECVPPIELNKIAGIPKSLDSLEDCKAMLNVFKRLKRNRLEDIAEDLKILCRILF